jgi:DNA-binding IclR family transcriptional regulator
MLGTVTRAGRLLDLYTRESPEWGPTAAARELGIAKSQAHELLTSLTAIGLLRRAPGGQFRLGWRTLALGRDVVRVEFPAGVFRVMGGLAQAFNEPVHLAALERRQVTIIARRPGSLGTDALVPGEEHDRYLCGTAVGKALLADLPAAELEAVLPEAPIDREILLADLAEVRTRRVAFDHGGLAGQLRGVAVPIRGGDGSTIAALGLWTVDRRWASSRDEMSRAVAGAGRRIESLIREVPDYAGENGVSIAAHDGSGSGPQLLPTA